MSGGRDRLSAREGGEKALGQGIVAAAALALVSGVACAATSRSNDTVEPGLAATAHTLRGALEDVMSAQQDHYLANGWYASRVADIDYLPPAGVQVRIEQPVDPRGYYAIATGGGAECAVFIGTSHPPRHYLTRREQVGCSP